MTEEKKTIDSEVLEKVDGGLAAFRVLKQDVQAMIPDEVKEKMDATNRYDKDVIVEEDVWIGSNVTLLGGAHLGRGSNIGSGSVVRGNVPPYAIVIGNPAKVVGFSFTPEQIVEHEKQLYPEEERIPLERLEKNYQKYFLKRIKEIRDFTRI